MMCAYLGLTTAKLFSSIAPLAWPQGPVHDDLDRQALADLDIVAVAFPAGSSEIETANSA
ncbi:MAG TPA: hypothetical protein VMM15_32130 [Bradyrhizobium sp.]|nr:hypothetical protein [Bradyrhizobium sp.]